VISTKRQQVRLRNEKRGVLRFAIGCANAEKMVINKAQEGVTTLEQRGST
jgi:hypothetical protein